MSQVKEDISIGGRGKEELLEVLKEEQDRFGYLAGKRLAQISKTLEVPLSEVYGVATFYSFLSTRPRGRNVIRICKSVPCFLKNAEPIIEHIGRELGIKPGETTADGRYCLELTNCIGACDKAPAMMVNHDVHGDLSPEKIARILAEYR